MSGCYSQTFRFNWYWVQPSRVNLLKLLDDFNVHNFWKSLLIQLKSNVAHKAILAYDLTKQPGSFADTYLAQGILCGHRECVKHSMTVRVSH